MKKQVIKKLCFSTVTFFICFSIISLFTSQAVAEQYTLKAVSAWPKNAVEVADDYIPFIKAVNEHVAKKYPGELKINYIGGPEVMPTRDQPEGLKQGTIDMLFGTAAYYVGTAPAANAGKLSELNSFEEKIIGADCIFNKIHREKLNAAYLGRLGSEIQFQLFSLKEITSLDDIKGMRIRTSAMYVDFIKALGATPVNIAPGEVYQALERGVVDGYMWPLHSIRPWGWQEVTEYAVGPPFYKVVHPILVNADTWDKLPNHLRLAIKKVLLEQAEKIDARSYEKMEKERKRLKKAGLEFIKFSPEEREKYLDMAYSSGWKGQLKMESEYTSQLRKLLSVSE
ncbi:MAG: TRAP transporter substrate-binding protein DctP [Desulfobacteraceae bacterium]|nr:TRAP transporter substrate-binding protein DctP [Desulfobacteraceae bacterium]